MNVTQIMLFVIGLSLAKVMRPDMQSPLLQLEKLLKNPEKAVVVNAGPVEKTIRPPRETMKNVQGSSAGVSHDSLAGATTLGSSHTLPFTGRIRRIPCLQAEP